MVHNPPFAFLKGQSSSPTYTDAVERVKPELIERLAAIEHERWSDWQKYVHSKILPSSDDGILILRIDQDFVERWERQIKTSYADLSETEKQKDRDQVARYLPLIEQTITSTRTDTINEMVKEGRLPAYTLGWEGGRKEAIEEIWEWAVNNGITDKKSFCALRDFITALKAMK